MENCLKKISENHSLWFKIALKICKDENIAKDLVQDMYLKVYDIQQKKEIKITNSYIAKVISNLFLKKLEADKKVVNLSNFEFKDKNTNFEPDDYEKNILNKLTFLERELLLIHFEENKSYHEIQKEYNINYQFARRKIINVKKKFKKK